MQVEIWILIDSQENVWTNTDPDCLDEDHEAVHPTRLLKVTLDVPAPESVELSAIVPDAAIDAVPMKITVK